MTDEIKAAAKRYIKNDYGTLNGYVEEDAHGELTGYVIRCVRWGDDVTDLADAYLEHLDREAERDKPIDREWMVSIGFDNWWLELSLEYGIEFKDSLVTLHAEDQGIFSSVYRLPLPHITTRGQVLDLLRVLGKEVKS